VSIDPDDLEPVPTVFALRVAGSNPIASSARITFDVPRTAAVTIGIFDVTGRAVATLADGVFEPGRYSQEWQTGRLSPGVYFLRMKAPGFARTQKLVTVR
jgi:hypothetical protein